ncbi:MBL fold metallo-hydrolase [Nocardia macrotermitis]|uniref:Hydroxyacylglutathione hydrolase n=1 Tax=Nocardia macrotermitis TaxID=2585198 RepID=A0A7K0CY75_9NOCA|nr:MBL fold metallo-hydrolase [Nocardia macrotermitis]MQY18391.1 Hydroxyacylglutathione hydrolase [Nocardia macrotermitis]
MIDSGTACFASANEWFDVREVAAGIHRLDEPGHVASYLVIGTRMALLFDSGMGIAPVSQVVSGLTALPVLVVSSHHHADHRGGNADLASHAEVVDFAAHPVAAQAGSGFRHDAVDPGFLAAYTVAMTGVAAEYERFRALDDRYFFTQARFGRMRPMPELSDWRIPATPVTRTLADGEVIDLGGRRLEVLHTPGHAPDTLCLFERESGILLSGDTVLGAAHWLHGHGADPVSFAASTRRLALLPVARVLAAHNLCCDLPASAVTDVATAADALLADTTTSSPGHDLLGHPVTRHDCGPVTLLTAPAAPRPT